MIKRHDSLTISRKMMQTFSLRGENAHLKVGSTVGPIKILLDSYTISPDTASESVLYLRKSL